MGKVSAWTLIWASTQPVLKVVLLCAVGAFCARKVRTAAALEALLPMRKAHKHLLPPASVHQHMHTHLLTGLVCQTGMHGAQAFHGSCWAAGITPRTLGIAHFCRSTANSMHSRIEPASVARKATLPSFTKCKGRPASSTAKTTLVFDTTQGILDSKGRKVLSSLSYLVFIPALNFTSLGSSLTPSRLLHWWPLFVNVFLG